MKHAVVEHNFGFYLRECNICKIFISYFWISLIDFTVSVEVKIYLCLSTSWNIIKESLEEI